MQRLATFLAIATLSVGCGDAFSPSGVAGTYSLRSINGVSIPATITEGGVSFTFNSGTLTLREDQTWLVSVNFSFFDGTTTVTETETSSGTFTLVEPNTIRFTLSDDGEVTTATIDGNRITVIDEDVGPLVFEK